MTDTASHGRAESASEKYSDGDLQALATKLDDLSVGAREPFDLLQRLGVAQVTDCAEADATPLIRYAERAFAYGIEDDPSYPGAATLGTAFGSAGGDWPPSFEVVPVEEKAAWVALGEKTTNLLPRTQLLDLGLCNGLRADRAAGDEVAQAYIALGRDEVLDPYFRVSCLRRAWSISRRFALPIERDVRAELMLQAQKWILAADVPVGVLLQPLEPLVVPPRSGPFVDPSREEVAALLQSALARPAAGAALIEGIGALRERLAESEEARTLARRDLVEGYLALARASSGMARVQWLESGAATALRYGLSDLHATAVTALQQTSVEELGLESVTHDFVIPRYAFDGRLSRYRRSRDALTALEVWFASPSPTGRHDANIKQARDISSSGILQFVTRTIFNSEGLPVRTTVGPESAVDEQLERVEGANAGVYSIVLANELDAISTVYGPCSGARVGAHLALRFGCDDELSAALGEAISSYWEGRHSDAGRAAFPLIEAGARGLLLTLGDPLYRIQSGNSDGRFPSLETYANRLEAFDFDADWLRCLRNPVARLRNALAHGHLHTLSRSDAALLLRTAALMVVLTPPTASAADRAEVEQRLRDPLEFVAGRAKLRRRWRRVWVAGRGMVETDT